MYIRKRVLLFGFVLSIAGFISYVLLLNEKSYSGMIRRVKDKFNPNEEHISQDLETRIGNPDPNDERDNNMVWEGSMYSVNYYNDQNDESEGSAIH